MSEKYNPKVIERCGYCVLEPGDVTSYKISIMQTPWEGAHNVVNIAVYDMGGTGYAFSYAADVIMAAWDKMKDINLENQLDYSEVGYLAEYLNGANPWTARAIIEGVARLLKAERR